MLYAKGGYAYSETRNYLAFAGAPFLHAYDRGHRYGYTVGAGLEYMFTPNWSIKGDYMYYNFDRYRFTTPVVLTPFGEWRNDVHTVKLGVTYRSTGVARSSPIIDLAKCPVACQPWVFRNTSGQGQEFR